MSVSIRSWMTTALVCASLVACKKSQPDATTPPSAGRASHPDAIPLVAMNLAAAPSAGGGFCIPATLAANGNITVEERVAGRFVDNKLLDAEGNEVFRIEGAQVVVPWNATKNLRIAADGSFSNDRDRFDVAANGVVSMGPSPSRCQVEGYNSANRRTAMALFVAPMLMMARAMAAQNGLLGAGADGGSAAPDGQAASNESGPPPRVRLIHAAVAANAAHVTVQWDQPQSALFEDVAAYTSTLSVPARAGSQMYSIYPTGQLTESARLLHGSPPELSAGKEYLAMLFDTNLGNQPTLQVLVEENVAPPPQPEGQSLISVFHAMHGTSAVELCAQPPGERQPTLIAEGAFEGNWLRPATNAIADRYVALPTASMAHLQLRAPGSSSCGGRLLGRVAAPTFVRDQQYVLVLAGGRSAQGPGKLLVCPRESGPCEQAPIRR